MIINDIVKITKVCECNNLFDFNGFSPRGSALLVEHETVSGE
jgi:hypothetical protein